MKCLKGMAMLINWVPTLKIGPTHLLSTMHQQQIHGVSKNASPKHMIMTTMYVKSSFCLLKDFELWPRFKDFDLMCMDWLYHYVHQP